MKEMNTLKELKQLAIQAKKPIRYYVISMDYGIIPRVMHPNGRVGSPEDLSETFPPSKGPGNHRFVNYWFAHAYITKRKRKT